MIAFVTTKPFWSAAWSTNHTPHTHTVGQLLKLGGFMGLSRQQERTQWDASSITKQVQLGSEATARTAEGVV